MDKFDCPYYVKGSCKTGEGGFDCSLPPGVPYTSCYPYKVEKSSKKTCVQCGITWQSTTAGLKELGIGGRTSGFYNPENLIGLTCTRCGKSFCKKHLGTSIHYSLPGGQCPSCGGQMNL